MTGYSSAHTRMTTTRLLCCSSLLALTLAASAHANPQGGQVVRGSAGISESGKTMTIHQHSDKAVIDWNSFNIELDEHTRFEQPSAGSAILNRVRGDQASQILGRLSANGKVVLVNPNGVHFGPNATVDVNSLIATTSDIDNDAFMADGSLRFTESGKPGAKVVNEGMITAAEAGLVGLVAPQVENHGIIQARLGKVEMASGDRFTLDLYGDGLVEIGISDEAAEQLIRNTGSISAEGGTIAITAAAARELVDSLIQIEGELKAPTITEHDDGRITIAGKDADIAVSGDLDVSGPQGGGTIEIGGGKQGQGPLPWADDTTITETASLKANATHDGDGGEVIVWAKDRTEFAGTIEAKGAGSGNGGFAETSGKDTLKVTNTASVDTGGGTWLLDPRNVEIANGSDVDPGNLATNLNSNNVVIHTSGAASDAGDITINDDVTYDSSNSLTLLAHRNITANNSIQNDGDGALSLIAGWDGSTEAGSITADANEGGNFEDRTTVDISNLLDISNNAYGQDNGSGPGSIFINSATGDQGVAIGTRDGTTTLAGYNITLQGGNNDDEFAMIGYRGSFDNTGNLTVRALNDLSLTGGSADRTFAQIGNGGHNNDNAQRGTISVSTDNGDISLSGGNDSAAYAQIGHGGAAADGTKDGAISVDSGGDLSLNGGSESAQIGHGGPGAVGAMAGAISAESDGAISLQGGSSSQGYAHIGHGGNSAVGSKTGSVNVESTTGLDIQAGVGGDHYAQIGHGGAYLSGDMNGAINVEISGPISLTGGSAFATYAQIGHGGTYGDGDIGMNHDSAVTVSSDGALSLGAGNGFESYVRIGHGGSGAGGTKDGAISVDSGGGISLSGGNDSTAYAQIGHGGAFADGDMGDALGGDTLSITSGGDLSLTSGSSTATYALLGHGGYDGGPAATDGTRADAITVTADGEISLVNGGEPVNIGHVTSNAGTDITNANVSITADALDFAGGPASGTYVLNNAAFITAMERNLEGGNVTLTSTGATLEIASPWNPAAGADKLTFATTNGQDIAINSTIDITTDVDLWFDAAGDVLLGADVSTTSNNLNPLVVSAVGDFLNSAGADALTATNARWLVYSNNPDDIVKDALVEDSEQFDTTLAADPPVTIGGSDNRILYAVSDPSAPPPGAGTGPYSRTCTRARTEAKPG